MAVLRAYIPASVSTMTRTCWLFISISVIAALAEATDLLSRCPSQVPRNSYLKATPWGKCYQFHMEERTWKNANHICASKGGHLVTIKEERVQSFLVLSLAQYRWPRNGLWIGATDQENEMDWRWVTGERVKDGYSRWASGQPSCGFFCFEDCAVMRWKEGGRWHDYRCNWLEDYSFICEYDMEPEPTTTTTTTTTTTSTTTTTTTTTPTTTTTVATTTTTEPTTLESLESEYLVHNHAHEEEEAINETTAILPPSVLLKGEGHAVAGQVQGHSTSSTNLGSGTITALIVSLLTTLAVGLCCLIFLIFRRRRRKQLTEQVGISYENPYYAETKTPLAAAADDNDDDDEEKEDDGERYGACGGVGTKDEASTKIAVERSSKLKPPPPPSPLNSRPKCVMNTYDSPPSLSTHKPVTTAAAIKGYKECNKKEDDDDVSLEEENHYDEIHSLQVATHSTYDVPKSSMSHKVQDDNMENFYYNDNEEENLYESVDNLRAMVDQRRRLRLDDTNPDQEEEARYVPFALDSSDPVQANN